MKTKFLSTIILIPSLIFGQVIPTDKKVNEVISQSLLQTLKKQDALSGLVIVSDVKSNKIIVAKSFTKKNGLFVSDNSLLSKPFEPGTLVLPISLSILLDDSKVDIFDTVDLENGDAIVNNHRILDNQVKNSGNCSYQNLIYFSSKVGIAKACFKYYKDSIAVFQKKFNRHIGYSQNSENTPIEYLSTGQGYIVKPMKLFSFYHSLASDGMYCTSSHNQLISTEQPLFEKTSTLRKVDECLSNINVDTKDWHYLQRENIELIAGITATIPNYNTDSSIKYYSSAFVGYFPVDNPQYCSFILINNKQNAPTFYGKTVSSSFVKDMIQLGIDKQKIDNKELIESMKKQKKLNITSISRSTIFINDKHTENIKFYYNESGVNKTFEIINPIKRYSGSLINGVIKFSGKDFQQ